MQPSSVALVALVALAVVCCSAADEDDVVMTRKKRSYPPMPPPPPPPSYDNEYQAPPQQNYGYRKVIKCYQCAYTPPKTVYEKKVIYQEHKYAQQQHYGQARSQYGNQGQQQGGGYGGQKQYGGYVKKTVVPVARYLKGGWDKCMGPFNHYQAQDFGIDVWDCHDNCYVRKDPNGDVFRGCYKGEFRVNPDKIGCYEQGGSTYCFCEGDLCNTGAAPN